MWRCICDCGGEYITHSSRLTIDKIRSCGCLLKDTSHLKPYYLKPSALPEGEASFRRILYAYKFPRRLSIRKLTFELTAEEARKLFKSNCFYCGGVPSTLYLAKGSKVPYLYNGIDRVDNTIGYTHTNCVSCCRICNEAKNNMSQQEFFTWVSQCHAMLHEKGLI
jgi:hypothetical protein